MNKFIKWKPSPKWIGKLLTTIILPNMTTAFYRLKTYAPTRRIRRWEDPTVKAKYLDRAKRSGMAILANLDYPIQIAF